MVYLSGYWAWRARIPDRASGERRFRGDHVAIPNLLRSAAFWDCHGSLLWIGGGWSGLNVVTLPVGSMGGVLVVGAASTNLEAGGLGSVTMDDNKSMLDDVRSRMGESSRPMVGLALVSSS